MFKSKTTLLLASIALLTTSTLQANEREVMKSLESSKVKYIEAVKKQRKTMIAAYDKAVDKLLKQKESDKALKLQDERDFFAAQNPEIVFNELSFRPFNLSDANWKNGISLTKAGFFVSNTERARKALTKGKTIKFSDGETRVIRRVFENGIYLNVDLDGNKLNSKKYGYPNSLEVVAKK